MVLGRVATEAKSNEITAIAQLLALLHLKGCIVTIDAMGCQTKIAAQITKQGGDYVLGLKGNQGTLATEVEEAFIGADAADYAGMDTQASESVERGHVTDGRIERRRYRTLGDLSEVPRSELWQGMNMDRHGRVAAHHRGQHLRGDARLHRHHRDRCRLLKARRARSLGRGERAAWSLDMTFREDECRVREPNARENLAVLRHIALTRLKQDHAKISLRNRRNKARWDQRYVTKPMFEAPASPPPITPSGLIALRALDQQRGVRHPKQLGQVEA